jgi:hypothetical protein
MQAFADLIGHGIRRISAVPLLIGATCAAAQIPSALPVDVEVHSAPEIVSGSDGNSYIVYELDIRNVDSHQRTLTLKEATVSDTQRASPPVATFSGTDWELMRAANSLPTKDSDRAAIPPATHALFFVWIKVPGSGPMPVRLAHAFTFQISGIEGTRSLACCSVGVTHSTLTVSAPLRGGQWAAVNGPSNSSDHRRALLPVDGHLYLGQRFAIDWMKLNDSGQPVSGDGSENKQFFGYSQPVLAVADGTVAAIEDGIPENKPGSLALKMDYSNIAGNFVSLDLGAGRFAGYAHLQPGSIRVKKGQRVHRGDVLGLLGNSGNSDAPHLHFEISDGPSLTQSEGLAYKLDSFRMTGSLDKELNFTPRASGEHRNELPLENVVVSFQ